MYQRFQKEFNVRNPVGVLADGPDEIRKACRDQFRAGADFIKITTTGGVTSQGDSPSHAQYTVEEIKVAVEEADMHGTYVSSHAQTLRGIKNVLKAGVMSIEHCFQVDDEVLELFAKTGAWIVPTFTILQCYLSHIELMPPDVAAKARWAGDLHFESIATARKAGIKIGYGTDLISDPVVCPYGENNLKEFHYLSKIGMSPMETIMAATKTGSEIIMRDKEVGSLEAGKLADITVCDGNPLENIDILTSINNIKLVMIDGKIKKDIL